MLEMVATLDVVSILMGKLDAIEDTAIKSIDGLCSVDGFELDEATHENLDVTLVSSF